MPASGSPFWRIIGRIWRPGAAVGLQGVGFAALGAFFSLYFLSRGWPYAGLGLTFFGVGFVLVRLLCGHLPDRIGGTPVAIASLAVEACGQYLLWLAPGPWSALAGALLTGLGCSMVFPAMGSEVVKQMPPHLRGTAVGGFAAFQDLAYGATGPLVGVAGRFLGLFGGIPDWRRCCDARLVDGDLGASAGPYGRRVRLDRRQRRVTDGRPSGRAEARPGWARSLAPACGVQSALTPSLIGLSPRPPTPPGRA